LTYHRLVFAVAAYHHHNSIQTIHQVLFRLKTFTSIFSVGSINSAQIFSTYLQLVLCLFSFLSISGGYSSPLQSSLVDFSWHIITLFTHSFTIYREFAMSPVLRTPAKSWATIAVFILTALISLPVSEAANASLSYDPLAADWLHLNYGNWNSMLFI
jgi:hypothetical protein